MNAPFRRLRFFAGTALALALGATPNAFAAEGGFAGPGPAVISVAEALKLSDDTPVSLRGNIVNRIGGDRYMFRDATGSIEVDIDQRKWQGRTVTPGDVVVLHGEIDKDFLSVEVDVDQVLVE